MEEFTTLHANRMLGILHGWDRVLFRGTLRSISYADGLGKALNFRGVLLNDFRGFADRCTQLLVDNAIKLAEQARRPYRYLASAACCKEQIARQILEQDPVTQGLVCVLSCVEPCHSFDLRRDARSRRLELVCAPRKCRFFYFYYLDERFGLMHVRLQSWLPFGVQVCVNGRSYLQKQLDKAGIGYEKADNCFRRIDDLPRAQQLMDQMTAINFAGMLSKLVRPLVRPLFRRGGPLFDLNGYYWTIRQSEYATDVMFKNAASLAQIYPDLCRHAIDALSCQDVLRFLGRTYAREREVSGDLRRRPEGVRVKHQAGSNGIKMYDKQGTVLRIETTINDPGMFRVLRKAQDQPESNLLWRSMRKAVADIARRARISKDANDRYLQAMVAARIAQPSAQVLDPVSVAVTRDGRSCRGLRPIDPVDASLLAAVHKGEHLLNGFTNRQVQACLFASPTRDPVERSRRCGSVSRKLRLLRGHGLIRKVGRSRMYRITPRGHRVMTVSIRLRSADSEQLLAK